MLKKYVITILTWLIFFLGTIPSQAATNFYGAIALTGGTSGALDAIDGDDLSNGDVCQTITSTTFYVHYLNASSGAGETSPDVISPDDNAGSKRWILVSQGDAEMAAIAQLTPTNGNFIVGDGSTWVAESGNTARTSLGLGTGDSPTWSGVTSNGVLTVKPDGTNETLQVNDGSLDLSDGNAGTAGTLTIDSSGNASYNKNFAAYGVSVSTKTDSYVVTTADLGKSIKMNSTDDKNFTLPSMGTSEDGGRLTFVKQGVGKMTITAVDTDYIDDSSATGTIYTITNYATITIEYVHGMTRWVIISANGTFTTT